MRRRILPLICLEAGDAPVAAAAASVGAEVAVAAEEGVAVVAATGLPLRCSRCKFSNRRRLHHHPCPRRLYHRLSSSRVSGNSNWRSRRARA